MYNTMAGFIKISRHLFKISRHLSRTFPKEMNLDRTMSSHDMQKPLQYNHTRRIYPYYLITKAVVTFDITPLYLKQTFRRNLHPLRQF